MTLYFTGLSELYREIEALGDPLTGISDRIDFERIRLILPDLHENDTEKSGRPNYDPILMMKILLLQQCTTSPIRRWKGRSGIVYYSLISLDILRNCLTGTPYGVSGRDCEMFLASLDIFEN